MKLKEFGPRGGARQKFYYVDQPLHLLAGVTISLMNTIYSPAFN